MTFRFVYCGMKHPVAEVMVFVWRIIGNEAERGRRYKRDLKRALNGVSVSGFIKRNITTSYLGRRRGRENPLEHG